MFREIFNGFVKVRECDLGRLKHNNAQNWSYKIMLLHYGTLVKYLSGIFILI